MKSVRCQKSLLLAGATAVWLATAVAAHAADAADAADRTYSPDDIIVTAKRPGYVFDDGSSSTKTPTPLINVPQTVSVVTRDQIEDQNVRQLGEALRYVAGVVMETGEGHRDEVFIRGQKTTADFFLNGLRDDAQYYRPLYNVERVEVLKGSNALTFGRGGGGGVINRVSKTAAFDRGFVSADGSINSFGGFAVGADINQPFGESFAGRLNATYEEFNSHRDFYEGRFFGINPTVTARLGDRTSLALSYSYEDDDRVTDRGVPAVTNLALPALTGRPLDNFDKTLFGDPDFNQARAKTQIARMRLNHEFNDELSFNLTGQYANYDKVYANVVPGASDGTNVKLSGYRDGTDRENWIAQGNLVWQGEAGGVGHTLLAGFEVMRQTTDNTRENALFASAGGPTELIEVPLARKLVLPAISLTALKRDSTSKLNVLAGYVQNQFEFGEMVQLIAGVRFESFDLRTTDRIASFEASRKDEKWSPRFGVVIKPRESLSLYASYTESFLPQAGDQFLVLSNKLINLAPEKFENLEAGIKWAIKPTLLLTASVFRLDRSNSRAPDPANSGFFILTGETRTKGAELQLAGDIASNWHANVGYTYLDGKVRSDTASAPAGTVIEQAPKHTIAAWTRYDFTDQLGLGAGVIHSSKQFASFSNKVVLPSYTRVDLAAYYDVTERVGVQVNVENLFDADYYPSAHGDNNLQPARPLNATVTLRGKM